MAKEKPSSSAQKELDKLEKNFEEFDSSIKEMTMDRMNQAPKEEAETYLDRNKVSQKQLSKVEDHYLKPHKVIGCRDKFNEKYREQYEYSKKYVAFIAENNEAKGETLDIWTRPFAGMPAEEWLVPTNKPVWGPRYLAEQIKRKYYHRLIMQEQSVTASDHAGAYYGRMAADTTVQRLDAHPVSQKKSIFMGDSDFT